MEDGEKRKDILLGSLKVKRRRNGKKFMVGYICLETLCEGIPEDAMYQRADGKNYLPVIVQRNLSPDKDGCTHSISVDSYFPSTKTNARKNEN